MENRYTGLKSYVLYRCIQRRSDVESERITWAGVHIEPPI